MYEVTDDYKKQIKEKVQKFRLTGTINGVPFTNNDILAGSFAINNQCSEQSMVKIGSVYIAELRFTIKPEISIENWEKAEIIVSEGLWVMDSWEDVPLGVYIVSSVEDTEYGVDVVAYDKMSLFNKDCNVDNISGTPYELLTFACEKCGVELGMSQDEIEAMCNGKVLMSLFMENDISTWQDFIFWIAQCLAAFATMSRIGKLVLRNYGNIVVDNLSNHNRFKGSKFSKFTTRYSSITITEIKENMTRHYGLDPDIYLTYNLGANPFLQYGVTEYKDEIRKNILNKIAEINYSPFETSVLCAALYDLGDVIRCSEGIASGNKGCIMQYDYVYNSGCKIVGHGADPALASAKGKADKNLEGVRNTVNAANLLFFTYENASEYSINDTEEANIIDIRFTSGVETNVIFQAEILVETTNTEAMIGYSVNGEGISYHPKEKYSDGAHIMHLLYMLKVPENTINRLIVNLSSAGGNIIISPGNIKAVVYGQGLVGTVEWDGYINIDDVLIRANIPKRKVTVSDILNMLDNQMIDVNHNMFDEKLYKIHTNNTLPAVKELVNELTFSHIIKSWTLNIDSEDITYSTRYIDVSDGSFRLVTNYINNSNNVPVDVGLMNVLTIDGGEFAKVNQIHVSEDGSNNTKYLICADEIWYTVIDGVLSEVQLLGDIPNSQDFITNGCDDVPESALLVSVLGNVLLVYKWTAEDNIENMIADIDAEPYAQTIQAICDMSDSSIKGIDSYNSIYKNNVMLKWSLNGGLVYTDAKSIEEVILDGSADVYNESQDKIINLAFILGSVDDVLEEFKYNYIN